MNLDRVLLASASDQARGIKQGIWSADELIYAERLSISQPSHARLRAYVTQTDDRPLYGALSSPLAGTGFAIKDNIALAGYPSYAGLRAFDSTPEVNDAPVVRRLKEAGLVCLGKLNMTPMALGASSWNLDFGNCENPCRIGYTPGGSSGGSGSAVAAGLCGIALGTDTMGSVRIPAAYCGVVGFKPSFGELSTEGVVPLCRMLDHVGIIARSVEDVLNTFIIARTPGGTESITCEIPKELAVPDPLHALGLDETVASAFNRTVLDLRRDGWLLHEVDLSFLDFGLVRRAGLLLCEVELLTLLGPLMDTRVIDLPTDLRLMLEYARRKNAIDLARALAIVIDAGLRLTEIQREHEMLLLPTAPQTAFPLSAKAPPNQADLTALANYTGGPAISLPLQLARTELPIGIQLMGLRGYDLRLLRQALRLETDISSKRPVEVLQNCGF